MKRPGSTSTVLLRQARIVTSDQIGQPQDILIRNGIIEAIGQQLPLPDGVDALEHDNLHVSAGWYDLGVQACDPGFESREDLLTAVNAAEAGGFTGMAVFPNTKPALHSKSEIQYVRNKTVDANIQVHPIGAVSHDLQGKDLAELYDMHAAGAIAFSDGASAVQDAGLLLRALQYTQAFDGLVINHPHHKTIAGGGQIHEGPISTSLGLKGLPALAEELMVQRDLSLLEYASGQTNSRLLIHLVSTAKSVELIRTAKAAGSPVKASVALANLCFTDEVFLPDGLGGPFDTMFKLLPPLRSRKDADALLEGILDGTIDLICTNHSPWDEEAKNLEFPYADFGMTGLETAFALYNTFLKDRLPLTTFIKAIALAPRQLLGLPIPEIVPGKTANLTLFAPDIDWTYDKAYVKSRSMNNPFIGKELKGKVVGIIVD